jgi:hypothetical protein
MPPRLRPARSPDTWLRHVQAPKPGSCLVGISVRVQSCPVLRLRRALPAARCTDMIHALVIGNDSRVSVIVLAVETAAVLVTVALMRVLQVRAFTSIQLAPTLAAIAAEGRAILDDLYRRPCPAGPRPAVVLPSLRRAVIWPHGRATLQQVHLPRLLDAADGAVIVLQAGPGDTLQHGAPVADLHGGDVTDEAVLRGLVTGQERTF